MFPLRPTSTACLARIASVVALAQTLACSLFDDEGPSTSGELKQGKFRYLCISNTDVLAPCSGDDNFPDGIAVGAVFNIEFESNHLGETDEGTALVQSHTPTRVDATIPGQFRLLAPGHSALVAERDGEVVDLLHVRGVVATTVELRDDDNLLVGEQLKLDRGEQVVLTAAPLPAPGLPPLAGGLDVEWSVTAGEQNIAIVGPKNARDVQIAAQRSGDGQLQVKFGDVLHTLEVAVGDR